MSNYDQMLAMGQRLFLDWDQQEMIRRYRLESDEGYLYLRYLGQRHRIERASGKVENLDEQRPAGFNASLSIFDYLCRDNVLPGMSGRWRAVNALKHTGQSNPSASNFHQRHADRMQEHIPALKRALEGIALAPFPRGTPPAPSRCSPASMRCSSSGRATRSFRRRCASSGTTTRCPTCASRRCSM